MTSEGDSDGAADEGAALLAAALAELDELLEPHPASAIAETARTAAPILRLVFNVSPMCWQVAVMAHARGTP